MCVEPQSLFMFIPSGLLFIMSYLIPNALNTFSATLYVAPFAVSTNTLKLSSKISSNLSSNIFLKKKTYSSLKSSLFSHTPILSFIADSSSIFPLSITSSISSSNESGIFIPLLLKYFTPLNSKVLCDAEITTEASALNFLVRYATAGVGITPSVLTFAP